MKATIGQKGNNLYIAIPRSIEQELGFTKGEEVEVKNVGGQLIVQRRNALDEVVQQMLESINPESIKDSTMDEIGMRELEEFAE